MAPSFPSEATHQWIKTSASVCYPHNPTNSWRLNFNYSSRKGEKASRKASPSFATKEEAMAGMLSFRLSWEYRSKGKLYKSTEADLAPNSAYAVAHTELPAGKSLNSLGVLNSAQESMFKRRRLDGSDGTREELMQNPDLSRRDKRALARGWNKRERKLRRDFEKRGSYLSTRIYDLTTDIHNNEQHILRLDTALKRRDLTSLLAPSSTPSGEDGDGAGDSSASGEDEGGGRKPEISASQADRLWHQAYTSLAVLREELQRDKKQLELIQEAKAVSEKFLPTEAAVKVADAKRFDLMNHASIIRNRSSLLEIGAKIQAV